MSSYSDQWASYRTTDEIEAGNLWASDLERALDNEREYWTERDRQAAAQERPEETNVYLTQRRHEASILGYDFPGDDDGQNEEV